ncbi:molybdate ABC transporter substrate-binding protein [Planomicrobium sp. MB-3u-38]|uniref:molybdate ABC transporter substrate-binding protein n=1 Tax=Planomicrobium sp. MB-3u-38 TaxID=2058318 RepID=UPI000C7A75F6|nr:molybdate ABC transporter substrate-binding protein [Planomicrobium sp. MB-3u-38]PKH08634.1 molybdate ABC transporter substrate-binding protein [Planomicrobium sp. MB-3u-38]
MKKAVLLIITGILLSACGNTSAGSSDELLISAASSLSEAMQAAEKEFQEKHPDIELAFNYGSSGKLRNQIQQGAPADLFLSASVKDMDQLSDDGLIIEGTAQNFAQNRLVLASAEKLDGTDLKKILEGTDKMIAVGEPESVPVGFYTKEALTNLGLWEEIEGELIFAKDARQVLSYVESGNAEMGFVYSSDARISTTLETIIEVPQNGSEIIYPAAVIESSANPQAAGYFLEFLLSDEGQKLLESYGFAPAKGELR